MKLNRTKLRSLISEVLKESMGRQVRFEFFPGVEDETDLLYSNGEVDDENYNYGFVAGNNYYVIEFDLRYRSSADIEYNLMYDADETIEILQRSGIPKDAYIGPNNLQFGASDDAEAQAILRQVQNAPIQSSVDMSRVGIIHPA
tara:strand:+ start:579 stop:1010 length:432 start_codon:yes stop_codon:yes gene_type:complete